MRLGRKQSDDRDDVAVLNVQSRVAAEVGKEFSWQDMPLYRKEQTASLIPPRLSYYPGTNWAFSRHTVKKIENKMAILY
jgi:hypothetical protein